MKSYCMGIDPIYYDAEGGWYSWFRIGVKIAVNISLAYADDLVLIYVVTSHPSNKRDASGKDFRKDLPRLFADPNTTN